MSAGGPAPLVTCSIAGAGARTPWGSTLARATTGWLAGLGTWELLRISDRVRSVARARAIPLTMHGVDRFVELGRNALREAAATAPEEPIPLLLVLSAPSQGEAQGPRPEDGARVLAELEAASGARLDRARSTLLTGDAGAAFALLARAVELLQSGGGPKAVLVGGIHSPLFHGATASREDLLDADRDREGDDHRVEGEGAAFLLLSAGDRGDRVTGLAPVVFDLAEIAASLERRRRALGPGEPDPTPENPWSDAWAALRGAPPMRVLADVTAHDDCSNAFRRSARADPRHEIEIELDLVQHTGFLGGAGPFVMAALARSAAASALLEPGSVAIAAGTTSGRGGILVLELAPGQADRPRPRPRLPAPSPAESVANAARAELFALAAELDAVARRPSGWSAADGPPGAGIPPALRAADAALRRLVESDLWDEAHLDHIDEAARALSSLRAAIPPDEDVASPGFGDEGVLRTLDVARVVAQAAADALAAVRTRAAEKAAALDVLRGAARAPIDEREGPLVRAIEVQLDPSHPPFQERVDAWVFREAIDAPGAIGHDRELAEATLGVRDALDRLETARIAHGTGPAMPRSTRSSGTAPLDLARIDARDRDTERCLRALESLGGQPSSEGSPPCVDLVDALGGATFEGNPDPTRAFALALALGSMSHGEGAFRACALLDRARPLVMGAIADGLALAASPRVGTEIALRLAREHDPDKLVALLSAASVRGAVRLGAVAPHIASPDPRVRACAARALGAAADRATAASILLAASSSERDGGVLASELAAALALGAANALVGVRLVIDEKTHEPGPFLRLLGLAGRYEDVRRLQEATPTASTVRWWGWSGFTELLDPLVDVLTAEARRTRNDWGVQSELARAAAEALQRITSAGSAPGGRHLALKDRRTSDRGDLATDPAVWREHTAKVVLAPRHRHRFGRAYELAESFAELGADGADLDDRMDAALEVAIRSGGAARPRDVVDRGALQRAAFNTMEEG